MSHSFSLTEATPLEIFLGRQPILDRNQNLFAYELLFRSSRQNSSGDFDDLQATASVISRVFGEMNAQDVLGNYRGFINVSEKLLMSDLIELLPRKRVVLELLETITLTDEIVQRCRSLKKTGYRLALDDVGHINESHLPLLEIVDIVKIDFPAHDNMSLANTVQQLRQWPLQLLAEKVESQEQADLCAQLGFELFQGYFFARPVILSSKGVCPSRLPLLKLLGLFMSDADTDQIEHVFRQSPHLTLNLMRLVNSVASGVTIHISSLKQAIMVLGRKQLQRWVQLLLFTLHPADVASPSPLMHMAATRGRIMELLARKIRSNDTDFHDQAFMAGLLSLLDVLLGTPLQDVIRQLNISEPMRLALLNHEGELGQLLALATQLEQADFDSIATMLSRTPAITPDDLCEIELAAMAWVNDLA
jgi:c-di-GMP-related signal transduction protein